VVLHFYLHFRTENNFNWLGHVMQGNGILREVMKGKMLGKKGLERPRIEMLDELLEKDTYRAMSNEDRLEWKI